MHQGFMLEVQMGVFAAGMLEVCAVQNNSWWWRSQWGVRPLCAWSLLGLRERALDSRQGPRVQAFKHHKAGVLPLASGAAHREVFAAGADGQISAHRLMTPNIKSTE